MKAIILAGAAFLAAGPAMADPRFCEPWPCPQVFRLQSVSETTVYGLLLEAPAGRCRHVRYRVQTAASVFLGHTPPLGPGEVVVVRVGRGFAEGEHALTIVAQGCADRPVAARRVTLAKASPDHGWRAARQVRPSFPWSPTAPRRDSRG